MTLFSKSFLHSSLNAKSALSGACAMAICLGAAAGAQAQSFRKTPPVQAIPSWYLSVTGSVNYVDDTDLFHGGIGGLGSGESSYDSNIGVSGAIGYRPRNSNSFLDHTRFEVEVGIASNDADKINIAATNFINTDEEVQADRVMANTYLDANLGSPFRPYVGAGLGLARVHYAGDEDEVLAYQGMAGVTYTPESFPIIEFGLGYRYFNAADVEVDASADNTITFDYESHSIEATIRAYF